MNEPHQLIYPTISLFLYDLRNSLGDEPEEIQSNRERFWRKLYPELTAETLTQLAAAENPDADFVELLGREKFRRFDAALDGYYFPLQLGDTYGLQVECSGPYLNGNRPNYQSQPIDRLHSLQKDLLSQLCTVADAAASTTGATASIRGSIGQTLLVWGQMVEYPRDFKAIARECYQQLMPEFGVDPDWERNFYAWSELRTGPLSGATIFELWRLPTDWERLEPINHVLICLFPHRQAIETIVDRMSKTDFDFIRLLHYRHKILWAYRQSRRLTRQLKAKYQKVQGLVELVRRPSEPGQHRGVPLKQLRVALPETFQILSDYTIALSDLAYQQNTLRTNLINYQRRMRKIGGDGDCIQPSSGDFLTKFAELVTEKYQAQIEADLESLRPGLALLENLISTIRGTVELDLAERDRTLNDTIAIAGIGLATSSLAAAVLTQQFPIDQFPPPKKYPLFILAPAFYGSLLTAAIASILTWIAIRLFFHRK